MKPYRCATHRLFRRTARTGLFTNRIAIRAGFEHFVDDAERLRLFGI
jgi:hypothetical protein